MFASCREEENYLDLDYVDLLEFKEKVRMMRWMDDLVVVVRGRLSERGRWALRRFMRTNAYGPTLTLKGTEGDECFGFDWREEYGILIVRQDEKWVDRGDHPPGLERASHMYGGRQFDNPRVKRGVVMGYILRFLDCTNGSRWDVELGYRRLLVELLDAEHTKHMLMRTARRVRDQALIDFVGICDEVMGWSAGQRSGFQDT